MLACLLAGFPAWQVCSCHHCQAARQSSMRPMWLHTLADRYSYKVTVLQGAAQKPSAQPVLTATCRNHVHSSANPMSCETLLLLLPSHWAGSLQLPLLHPC